MLYLYQKITSIKVDLLKSFFLQSEFPDKEAEQIASTFMLKHLRKGVY
jgi:hypothetical protein